MATTIKLKNSVTTTAAPSTLVQGETAVNITDKKVWVGDASSTPVQILGAGAPVSGTTGTFTGNTTVAGTFSANGGATLGDASGDALTINSTAVSIPNGLNFDSNTFVIDATNNRVGINVAAPSATLQVVSAGTALCQFTGAQYSQVRHSDGTRVFLTQVYDNLGILGMESNTPLMIMTNNAERMRITSTGNVGIGTSSPSVKFHVSGGNGIIENATSAYLRVSETSTGNSNRAVVLADSTGMNLVADYGTTAIPMVFKTSNTERMRLDSSGNLGLGVTPSAWFSTIKAFQFASTGSLEGRTNSGSIALASNSYIDTSGDTRYITTNYASRYQQNAGAHYWYNAPSGTAGNAITFTQAMTLDASGNLGIGTTSPAQKLQVSGTGSQYTSIVSTDSGNTGVLFGDSGRVDEGYVLYANSDNSLRFGANNATERMRIDSSGNLLVDATSTAVPNDGLIYLSRATTSVPRIRLGHASGTISGGAYIEFMLAGITIGSVTQSGTSAVAYNTTSDYRLKENQAPLTGSGAFIDALKPKTWTWANGDGKGVGFIAHEVQAVSPNSVVGEKDAVDEEGNPKYQAMEYGSAEFIANIISELQDLRKRVATLESK